MEDSRLQEYLRLGDKIRQGHLQVDACPWNISCLRKCILVVADRIHLVTGG